MQESFGKRDTVFHTRTWGQWIMYQARRSVANLSANFSGNLSLQEKSGWEELRALTLQSINYHHPSVTEIHSHVVREIKSLINPTGKELRRHSESVCPQASWTPQVGFGPVLQTHSFVCWAPWS